MLLQLRQFIAHVRELEQALNSFLQHSQGRNKRLMRIAYTPASAPLTPFSYAVTTFPTSLLAREPFAVTSQQPFTSTLAQRIERVRDVHTAAG